jgi:NAD(P)-dependent dehydrogenase (short-subunit alcohol dehydrogenase family)
MDGKNAIVTGGAKGIGYAIAKRYLEDGARVIIADQDERAGETAREDLSKLGDIRFVAADVAQRLDVRNLVAKALDALGNIDILVNNAGISHTADFLELKEADFDRVLGVNLKGVFLCGQAVARHMVDRVTDGGDPGCIINISSINSVVALPDQLPYCVSKGGVAQLTRVMALSLATHGIRVNAIGPGSIMTDLLNAVVGDKNGRGKILSRTPLGRIGEPGEIAGIAAFLASRDASYITGQTVFADGGRLPLNYTVPVAD